MTGGEKIKTVLGDERGWFKKKKKRRALIPCVTAVTRVIHWVNERTVFCRLPTVELSSANKSRELSPAAVNLQANSENCDAN